MPEFLTSVLTTFLLVCSVSIDSFVASLAYGTSKIKIPFCSVVVISLVCTAMLTISSLLGSWVRPFLPPGLTKAACFGVLFVIGVIKLSDSLIKTQIRKGKKMCRQLKFSVLSLNFILNVYADPEQADADQSKVLSPLEALSLAAALSLDGLAAGFGAALTSVNLLLVLTLSFGIGLLSVSMGGWLGRRIGKSISFDLSWIGGAILILLACLKWL